MAGDDGHVKAFRVQPQIVGKIGSDGRPAPTDSKKPPFEIPCDIVIMAVGQAVETDVFEDAGVPVKRGRIVGSKNCAVKELPGVFTGGDCMTGPATVIRAIEAGKVAAANIDNYLGYDHKLEVNIDISFAALREKPLMGRVEMTEREACERKCGFELCEIGMTREEVSQESRRCLRCDHFGFGALGEVETSW